MGGYGKWIGAILGYIVGKGLLGAVVGFVIGYLFDRASQSGRSTGIDSGELRSRFFATTFEVMGHVAKSDGRVTDQEIRAARETMRRFALSESDVQRAIELFTAGKEAGYPLEERVGELRDLAASRPDLYRTFLLIQLDAAMSAGGPSAAARAVLQRVAAVFAIGAAEFAAIEAMLRMHRGTGTAGAGGDGGARRQGPPRDAVADAYQVLGIAPTASDAELTLAYRRLMSRNHPDKMVANGLPESMVAAAHERTRQIIEAYETIKRARGRT